MTCVVALVTQGGSYIGSDSITVEESGLYGLALSPKVARFKNTLVGFAGSWKVGQEAFRLLSTMANPLPELFIKRFKTEYNNWAILMVSEGRVYEVNEDMAIVEVRPSKEGTYASIGTGAAVALGSLYTDHIDKSSVMTALRAAEAHVASVRRPFTVLEIQ